jgi:hypothetical protein
MENYGFGNSKARIVMRCEPCLARQKVTCGDSPRDMMSRHVVDGRIVDQDQRRMQKCSRPNLAAAKCRMDGAFATPNIALHISH